MGLIRVNYGAAETASAQLRTANGELNRQMGELKTTSETMIASMDGATQQAYDAARLAAQQSFDALAQNVEQVARLLDQHAMMMREADAAGARSFAT